MAELYQYIDELARGIAGCDLDPEKVQNLSNKIVASDASFVRGLIRVEGQKLVFDFSHQKIFPNLQLPEFCKTLLVLIQQRNVSLNSTRLKVLTVVLRRCLGMLYLVPRERPVETWLAEAWQAWKDVIADIQSILQVSEQNWDTGVNLTGSEELEYRKAANSVTRGAPRDLEDFELWLDRAREVCFEKSQMVQTVTLEDCEFENALQIAGQKVTLNFERMTFDHAVILLSRLLSCRTQSLQSLRDEPQRHDHEVCQLLWFTELFATKRATVHQFANYLQGYLNQLNAASKSGSGPNT